MAGNHWVTLSSFGREVTIYDSKYSGKLTSSLTHQLVRIYRPLVTSKDEDGDDIDPELVVKIANVKQQQGAKDCGLFAIDFQLHVALGDDPEQQVFEQPLMRSHLFRCFLQKKLEPFPHRAVSTLPIHLSIGPIFSYKQIELFCTCLMPETFDDMVACDQCEQWYHLKCVGLSVAPQDSVAWLCSKCCN